MKSERRGSVELIKYLSEVTRIHKLMAAIYSWIASDLRSVANQESEFKDLKYDIGILTSENPEEINFDPNSHDRLITEMIISRLVDNYQTYLTEVIRAILRAKPEILRSSEQVKLEYVLNFDNIDALITDLIDQKAYELGHRGFSDLDKWCDSFLGVQLARNQPQRDELIEIIETRNLIIHNRSQVNKKYLSKVKGSNLLVGKMRPINHKYLMVASNLLSLSAMDFDTQVVSKFNLV